MERRDLAAIPVRTQRWLAMAATMTLEQIARQEGLSRERVRQVLARVGFSRRELTRPCVSCGAPMPVTRRGGYCAALPCRRAYARAYTEATRVTPGLPRRQCAHCGATLKLPARTDGKPSFCVDKKACRAARHRWLYRNSPAMYAYAERYRKSERGREVQRAAAKRYWAKRGVELKERRAERRRARSIEREQMRAHAVERRAASEARAAARAAERAAAQERRAAADAVAAARAREAIRLYRTLQLSERAVAEQLGVSRTIVHYWVAGKRRPAALAAEMGDAG
ncbi:MAG TPA: hypothetical protein VFN74_08110 [Chloroflexota bacterium]|nr:hypothetical protein [Chloroflexota bacterium]